MAEQIRSPLWKIGWGFTAACNMACPFCYSRTARTRDQEVPLSVAKRFIAQNASEIASINYGTGESTLSPAWYELISFVRDEYPLLRQALTTNGTLSVGQNATTRRAAWANAIDEVDVSIDFADPVRHNQMRGHPHAFEWAVRALELCAEEGIVSTIVFVGFAETLQVANLEQLTNLAAKYGAFLRLNILRPTSNVTMAPPTPLQVYAGLKWLLSSTRVVSLCDPLFGALFDPEYHQPETTGVTSLRILPDGSVTPSTYLITEEWKGASIYNEDVRLSEIGQSPAFLRLQQAPVPAKCLGCEHVQVCRGGAVDRRVLHYQTLEERDPYCPYRGEGKFLNQVPIRYHEREETVPSVHDGYLPTLIFAP